MTRRDPFWDDPVERITCEKCGERYAEGDWPYCASKANHEGHSKGAYGFKMKFPMKTQGWTRRER